jgi:D-alanyl-D-alanine carboxypeptidase
MSDRTPSASKPSGSNPGDHTTAISPSWGWAAGAMVSTPRDCIPGYASQNYTDSTGRRTGSVITTTQFGLRAPELEAADQKVVDAAVCTMLGKPIAAN